MTDFADIDNEVNSNESEFVKPVYIRLTDGNKYNIRILEPKATKVYAHFLGGRYSVKCLGDSCPICKTNTEIYTKDPENFRKDPNYAYRQKRYYVNVLDKTPVKKCPNCNKEYTNFNMGICNECSTSLNDPEPSNTVKILSKGPAVFSQFNDIHNAVLDESGEAMGINNFDLTLVVNGKGKDTKITVIPEPHKNEPVEEGLDLFDLSNPVVELEPDEMLDVQRGVSLKDIFAARRAEEEAEFPPESGVSDEDLEDVTAKVAELFSD